MLWGRTDLFGQIFHTATLTETDFVELQGRLQTLNPSRSSESYIAMEVLATKAEFLRSKSFVDDDTAAYFATCDTTSEVPQLIVDTPPLTPNIMDALAVDTAALDVGADVIGNTMDIDTNHDSSGFSDIITDQAYLSEDLTAIFPYTIRYIDLTILHLEHLYRVPHLMFIRDEWRTMVNIFNRRKKGIHGGAAFTGQPGTGKTCLLYYILILCIIRAQPIVFQDMAGELFLINDAVRHITSRGKIPQEDILALVDADGEVGEPRSALFDTSNLRVLLVSSPKGREDRRWLTQSVGDIDAVFVMMPWSREEFLVASLFISRIDITLKRFQDITRICGYIPRQCFAAALSPMVLSVATNMVINAISETKNLDNAIFDLHIGQSTRLAFQIWPT
ncbi:hypothetical protein PILCRDRAFT_138705 [Piloderma croceum F 1598]|uniref:Uncharacterized protein n=1 Tax=Piloderma croceum (strain F 1598) TaxID=765440 RepID=A0A0C3CQ00_PILCF|nr:hypothetical protein PILCRDRAFT_138705 [Piloderma croceum F 1598]